MWMVVMIALQSGAVAGPVLPKPRQPATARRCPVAEDGESDDVIVCAKPSDAYRMPSVRDYSSPLTLPQARTDIPGVGTLSAETEQGSVGGFVSNRAMVRLKIPLGGRRKE
jgi:hypothetical protein